MMHIKKFILILFLLMNCSVVTVFADENPIPYSASDMRFTLATNGTMNSRYNYRFVIPALRADNALMKKNDIQLRAAGILSPVSFTGNAEINVSPAAVLRFFAIGSIGTGWDIPIAMGIKITSRSTDISSGTTGETTYTGEPLSGFVWGVKFGGLFQFDLAAVVPGD